MRAQHLFAAAAAMFVLDGLAAGTAGAVAYAPTQPPWAEAPSVSDVAAAYPARAKANNVSGKAELSCSIGHDDRPRDCAVLRETGNYGFGAAAKKLAEKLKVDRSGMYGREVYIPFVFDTGVLGGSATVTQAAWASQPDIEDYKATFPKSENGVNHVRVVLGRTGLWSRRPGAGGEVPPGALGAGRPPDGGRPHQPADPLRADPGRQALA